MIQKEIIWNIALLFFGAFLVFAFTSRYDYNISVIPGWHNPNTIFTPLGPINLWITSLIVGICLIIFRYINLAILTIRHTDLRLVVLLLSYSVPIFLILIAYHYSMNDIDEQVAENHIPIETIEKKIKELRQFGLFKKYKEKTDDFIADIVIARFVRKQGGYFNSRQLWTEDYKNLRILQLLRLDTDKTWQKNNTEWVVEGNRAYEDFIKELGEISEDNFKPTNIKESWLDRKTIEITFDIEGQKHKILPIVHNDWADTEHILKYINNLLKAKNYQFYYAKGEDNLIIGLNKAEERLLTENIKIEFDNPIDKK